METAAVVVIGAGANGTSTAFYLAQLGAGKVVVVEQGHLAAGASGKSGALVRTSYANESETCLAVESMRYFAHWADLVRGSVASVRSACSPSRRLNTATGWKRASRCTAISGWTRG